MRPSCKHACAFALSFVLIQGSGLAQEPDPAAQTYGDEITVTGTGDPALTLPEPETAAQELGQAAGGTALVDAETYRRGRTSTLKDALDFTPGVFVQPRFGSEEARLSIRGSGLQRTFHGRGLKLLQDGVPLNLADGGFDFQAVEPLSARYIEVYRGANALRYGGSTLGGAINFVSESGHGGAPVRLRLEGGAFGYARGQAGVALERGRFDSFLSLAHSSQEGFREHAGQSSQRFFGNFGYDLRDGRETRFFVSAVRTDSELPGNLTLAQMEDDPTRAAPGNVALDQKRDFDLFRLSNRTTFRLGRSARLDLGTFWSYKHLDHPIFQVLDQTSNDLGADLRYETVGEVGGRANVFVAGVSPVIGFVQDDRFVNAAGRRGAPTARGETASRNLDVYSENRHELRPGVQLSAGLQLSYAERDFEDDFLANGDQTDLQTYFGASPKLGLRVELAPEASAFANVSRSFEPPTFGELANLGGSGLLQLDAQTATSIELGSRGRGGRATWDAVLYHAWVDDELLSLNDAAGNPLGTINAGRTLHTGAELGVEVRFGGALLRQVYNWSRFVFADDPAFGDNRIAGLPEHFFRTELVWERGSGLYAGPNVEWVPDRYPVDHANTLFAEGYAILGFKLGYRPVKGLAWFVEGKNLTDETYAATTGVIADARGRDSAQFLPGDGASVFAGIEYRW